MSALRTTILGILTTIVGVWAALSTAVGAAVPGVETYARVHPAVLIVGGVLTLLVVATNRVVGGRV